MRLHAAAAATFLLAAGPAASAVIGIQLGDDDCFGLPSHTPCGDGDLFASVAPTDRSTAGDPAGTDAFGELGTVALDFFVDLAGEVATAAVVSAKTVGLDLNRAVSNDAFNGARFLFNGTDIGDADRAGAAGHRSVERRRAPAPCRRFREHADDHPRRGVRSVRRLRGLCDRLRSPHHRDAAARAAGRRRRAVACGPLADAGRPRSGRGVDATAPLRRPTLTADGASGRRRGSGAKLDRG